MDILKLWYNFALQINQLHRIIVRNRNGMHMSNETKLLWCGWCQFNSLNLTSKDTKFNITQHLSQCLPAHWLFSLPSSPFLEDLCVDSLSILSVLKFQVANSSSIGVIQEVEAKVVVLDTNLLGNVYCSLSSSEPGALQHSGAVCIGRQWKWKDEQGKTEEMTYLLHLQKVLPVLP